MNGQNNPYLGRIQSVTSEQISRMNLIELGQHTDALLAEANCTIWGRDKENLLEEDASLFIQEQFQRSMQTGAYGGERRGR